MRSGCQGRQERRSLSRAHFRRMALVVKEDKAPNPADLRLLSAVAVVPRGDGIADLVEQLGLGGGRPLHDDAHSQRTGPDRGIAGLLNWRAHCSIGTDLAACGNRSPARCV